MWKNLLIFGITLLILRVPSFFFSWWYEDENIYLAVGQALAKGQMLYVDAWDNKPPLIYLLYAAIYSLFNTQTWAYKVVCFFLAAWQVSIFSYILKDIFKFSKQQVFWAAFSMAVILGVAFESPILNGENVFIPLVLSGFYLVYREFQRFESTNKIKAGKLILGGIFWSLASLTKIHAVVEIGILLLAIGLIIIRTKSTTGSKPVIQQLGYFILLPLMPIAIGYGCLILFYSLQGYSSVLFYSILGFSKDYVHTENIPVVLGFQLKYFSGLQLRAILLGISLLICAYLFWTKQLTEKYFILFSWLSITVFASLISERPYGHYLLQTIPPAIILLTLLIHYIFDPTKKLNDKILRLLSVGLAWQILLASFPTSLPTIWNYYNVFSKYFGQFFAVSLGKMSLSEWQKSYDLPNYESQHILPDRIQQLTTPEDKIFLYGNLAEIYPLSSRLNGTKWFLQDHIIDFQQLYREIMLNKPKLIVVDSTISDRGRFIDVISANYKNIFTIQNYDFWLKQ